MLNLKPKAAAADPGKPTAESLGQELLAALPTIRMHSVSLHDEQGDVAWLSEGALGPDEHSAVVEAMSTLGLEPERTSHALSLGDGRSAAFVPARAPSGDLVGAAMIVTDTKTLAALGDSKLASPQVLAVVKRFAALIAPEAAARAAAAAPPANAPVASAVVSLPASPTGAAPARQVASAATELGPVIELSLVLDAPPPPAPTADSTPATAPSRPAPAAVASRSPAPANTRVPATAPVAPAPARPAIALAATGPAVRPRPAPPPSRVPTVQPAARASVAASRPAPAAEKHEPRRLEPEFDFSLDADDLTPSMVARLNRDQIEVLAAAGGTPPSDEKPAPSPPRRTGPAETDSRTPPAEEATLKILRPDSSEFTLYVQQLLKLRSGGRTRRYEVLLRSRADPSRNAVPRSLMQAGSEHGKNSALDRYVLGELLRWLAQHREVWETDPASFSVNLCSGTLLDEGFGNFITSQLESSGVSPEVLGFEIGQADCVQHRRAVERLVETCEKIGCYVVLDDFTLHSEAVPLLATKAVRVVKIDAQLTTSAMTDKLSQALVIAISQACKVLGAHCVAKRIDTTAARQWLAAVGIDFAQGFLLEKPTALESLAS